MKTPSISNDRNSIRDSILLMTGASILLLIFFYRLLTTMEPVLTSVQQSLDKGKSVKLDQHVTSGALKNLLTQGRYFNDERDAALLAGQLAAKMKTGFVPANLGALNKKPFHIPAGTAWNTETGGDDFHARVLASRQRLGFDSALYNSELNNPRNYPSSVTVNSGSLSVSGMVSDGEKPIPGTLVQLREHVSSESDSSADKVHFARTDASGSYTFQGLLADSSYSVLPLKPGFEFGTRKGTAWLKKNTQFNFNGQPHQIRVVGSFTYSRIKDDAVFLIRTPEEFRSLYWLIAGTLIGGFVLTFLILLFRKKRPDLFLLPILLLLCGISLLTLFSIQDPLTDTLYAGQVVQGIVAGLIVYVIFSILNPARFQSRWWFDPLFNYRRKQIYALKGWTWLILAIALSIVTVLLGTGPEGSGVKVNLQLGGLSFQPSEITKFLLIIFLAAFFSANHEQLKHFSDIRWRFKLSWSVLAGVAAILILFLLMGDMGPALVVCFTFLFFYGLARGNLLFTLTAAALYVILLMLMPAWVATGIAFAAAITASIFLGHLRTTKWYGVLAVIADTPVMMLLVIAAFTFGDQVPGIGERLSERKEMWLSPWNNDVYGGDHLAHSYWTLSGGGISGQGIGKGYPNTMPASHTDMILSSIGEEWGWTGLLSVLLLFILLIHRSFLHARRSGNPFCFYLASGIALATGIQFLLIAGGAFGILPLTGITVPFLSYGKVSLFINIAATGIISGISSQPGKQIQQEFVRKYYDPVLATGLAFFAITFIFLAGRLFFIQVIDRDEHIIRQARVVMRNGTPIYSYNPRIDKLMDFLAAGNVYDRKGMPVATSNPDVIHRYMDSLSAAGLDKTSLSDLALKKLDRYYPFNEHLFFWTGDYNSKLFWGQHNGYFAEARHLTSLRGYGISKTVQDSVLSYYRPDRFTKPYYKNMPLTVYDFSVLAESLKQGIDSASPAIRKILDKDRNVVLSIDAGLQKEIQDSLRKSAFHTKRISVVVMDAASGDLLASAVHPLPAIETPELLTLTDRERNQLPFAVTDRDLGMTYATAPGSAVKILTAMAALNKIGTGATAVKYNDIYRNEIFRDNQKEQEPFVPRVKYVDMREAIVHSSNIYFIRMANDYDLEEELAELYQSTGMHLNQAGGYNYDLPSGKDRLLKDRMRWKKEVLNHDRKAYSNPENYGKTKRYRSVYSGLAWGQSVLTSTPASMARMAAAIANYGQLQPSRYVLKEAGIENHNPPGNKIAGDTSYAGILTRYMIDQSNLNGKQKVKGLKVAGKTGTPERIVKGEKTSDGWYVFFAPTPGKQSATVTCIRIEEGLSSANAVLLGNTVASILQKRNYLISF